MRDNGKMIAIPLADDDEEDRMLTRDALVEIQLLNEVYFVEDGEELINYLHAAANTPHLPRLLGRD